VTVTVTLCDVCVGGRLSLSLWVVGCGEVVSTEPLCGVRCAVWDEWEDSS
jgi:hypothetical protein